METKTILFTHLLELNVEKDFGIREWILAKRDKIWMMIYSLQF